MGEQMKDSKALKPLIFFDGNKISKDIKKAVHNRLAMFGKGFWCLGCEPWIHPYNKVRNCIAISIDGFIGMGEKTPSFREGMNRPFYLVIL